ncbi:MAG: hypothetical protein ACE5ID_03460, partial [Acidobacteriota bacterium]
MRSGPVRRCRAEATNLATLRGIGPSRARELGEMGLEDVDDLLALPPRRYENRTRFPSLQDLVRQPSGVRAALLLTVHQARIIRTRRRGFTLVRAELTDGKDMLKAIWFNQPYLARHLETGRRLILYGALEELNQKDGTPSMRNPDIEMMPREGGPLEALHTGRIVPIYRRMGHLSSRLLRRIIHQALAAGAGIPEFLPRPLLERRHLLPRAQALLELHFPPPSTSLTAL